MNNTLRLLRFSRQLYSDILHHKQCLSNHRKCVCLHRQYHNNQHHNRENNNRLTLSLCIASLGLGVYFSDTIMRWFSQLPYFTATVKAAQPTDGSKCKPSGKDPPRNNDFIADVVEEASPCVVFIEILDNRRRDWQTGKPMRISNGSGFIVESDGLILTNAHVVNDRPANSTITVMLQDGREFKGRIEDVDRTSDLATVRINSSNLPTLPLGDSAVLRPGQWVVAMGSPLSLTNTITVGVISSKSRSAAELGANVHQDNDIEYLQTDAAITFGNSGGPLVNLQGQAIGINSMKVTAGISFAIPSNHARKFLQLSSDKRSGGGWFKKASSPEKMKYVGLTMLTLTPQVILELQQRQMDMPRDIQHGVLVWRVVVGSPADRAGIVPGDVITAIDGATVKTAKDMFAATKTAEESIKVTVLRGNKKFNTVLMFDE